MPFWGHKNNQKSLVTAELIRNMRKGDFALPLPHGGRTSLGPALPGRMTLMAAHSVDFVHLLFGVIIAR
jgi:hypothetical protein